MTGGDWDVADWVRQFEEGGGIVFPNGLAMGPNKDCEGDRLHSEALFALLGIEGRWKKLFDYANSPERLAILQAREKSEDDFDRKSDKLIIDDYLDAMAKFKGQPSKDFQASRCLELIQRDYFGLLDEEMEFSEASLAVCLREIASEQPKHSLATFFLNGVANALDSTESPWQLKLSRKKWAGKFRPVSHSSAERARWALWSLEHYESKGWPTEAAITQVAENLGGMSRASAFKIVKEGREHRQKIAEILAQMEKSSD